MKKNNNNFLLLLNKKCAFKTVVTLVYSNFLFRLSDFSILFFWGKPLVFLRGGIASGKMGL